MAHHNDLGTWGEEMAANYLNDKGYFVIERNWHSGHREIDIIARKERIIVFAEVKTRQNRTYADPEDAVNWQKIDNMRKAANHYLVSNRLDLEVQFDIITVVGTPETTCEIEHIEDINIY